MADPVLKWAGGKRQLIPDLLDRFPAGYDTYHEPMVGAGALFFEIEPSGASINDTNPRLVNFYQQVRENPDEVIEIARGFDDPESDPDAGREFSDHTRKGKKVEKYYYQQRALFNRRPNGESFDETEEAALLLYLNRTCYNGLYRENQSGEFNVPIGRYSNPDWVRATEIREASKVLQRTRILNEDFEYILEEAGEGDLVYFDPPYKPMSATASFTEYSQDGFDAEDQQRLLETCSDLDAAGVQVIMSNSGVMYDHYLDAGFEVEREGATRAINSDAENRGEVDEIIATNIPEESRGRRQTSVSDFST